MKIILPLVILLSALLLASAPSVAQTVHVGADRPLDSSDMRPHVEPHLAAHPGDPSHLVVAAMVAADTAMNELHCATFVSVDAGETWDRRNFPALACGDPWVSINPDGSALFVALWDRFNHDEQANGLLVFHSADGGRTWPTQATSLGGGHDHPTLVRDDSDGPFGGHTYVVSSRGVRNASEQQRWAVYVARSSDGGGTFDHPTDIVSSNLSYEAQTGAVLPNGVLIVPFQDHRTYDGKRRLTRRRSWVLTSSDGGRTFSEPLFVTEWCTTTRYAAWPSLVADVSGGAFRGRLYFVCERDEFDGIQIHVSDDGGDTWSERRRIDGNVDGAGYTKTPSIAVNHDGVVAISWYDRRNDPDKRCQDIYFSASTNGGETFSPARRVTTETSCPETPHNGYAGIRFPAGGEYAGLAAAADGRFHLVWADSRTGAYQLRTAIVTIQRTAEN